MYDVQSRRSCPLCNIQLKNNCSAVMHLGVTHGAVDIFLEPQHHIAKGRCEGQKRVEDLPKTDKLDAQIAHEGQLGNAQLVSQKGQHGDRPARLESSSVSGKVKSLPCSKCSKVYKTRSFLYLHYAITHFKQQIYDTYGMREPGHCPLCSKWIPTKTSGLWHFGMAHGMVEACLEPEFHVAGKSWRGKKNWQELSKPTNSDSCGQSNSVEEGAELDSDHNQEAIDGAGQQNCGQPGSSGDPSGPAIPKKRPCAKCLKTFETRSCLYQHYAQVHFKQQIAEKFGLGSQGRCPLCNLMLKSESTVRWHLGVIHGAVEEFLEPQFHVAKNRQRKPVRKPIHPTRSVGTGQLEPLRSNSPFRSSKFPCSKCTKTFDSRNNLYQHYAIVHFKQQLLETFGSGRECLICNKKFRNKLTLLFHLGITHSLVDTFLEPEFHVGKISEREMKPKLDEGGQVLESGCDYVDDGFKDIPKIEQAVSLVELSVSKNMIEERGDFEHEDDYYDDYMDLLDSPESFENEDSIKADVNIACTAGTTNVSSSSDQVEKGIIGEDEEDSKRDCGLENVLEDEMYSSSDDVANLEIEKRADKMANHQLEREWSPQARGGIASADPNKRAGKMADHQLGSEWSPQTREDIATADPDVGHTDQVDAVGEGPISYPNNGDSGASTGQTMVITQVWSMYKPHSVPDLPVAGAKTDQQQAVSLQKSSEPKGPEQNGLPDLDVTTSIGSCVISGWPVTPDSGLSKSAEGTDGSSSLCPSSGSGRADTPRSAHSHPSPGSGRANTSGSADCCPSPGCGGADTSRSADSHPSPGSGRANISVLADCCPSPGSGRQADTPRSADSHHSPGSGRANISGLADYCPSPGSGRADTHRSADSHPSPGSGRANISGLADCYPSPGSSRADTSWPAHSHPSPGSGRAETPRSADSHTSPGNVSDSVSGRFGKPVSEVGTVTTAGVPGSAQGNINSEPARPRVVRGPLTAPAATPATLLSVKTLVEQCFSDSSDEDEEASGDE